MKKNKLIVICGATASGKTAAGMMLADYLDIEIISADSRQIYKLLNIGTAKPTHNELKKIHHHFIDCVEIDANYSAGEFGNQAYQTYLDIIKRGKIPVVIGGSGLYIKALCEGLFESGIVISQEIKDTLQNELSQKGIEWLYEQLRQSDMPSYLLYKDRNPRRILRALEYYRATGMALSKAHNLYKNNRDIEPLYFAIDYPRDELYGRINGRVHQMWDMGLANETQSVLNMGYSPSLNALNTVGYKETIQYLQGAITTEKAIEEIQKNTRHYAKRQLTWFRKIPYLHIIPSKTRQIVETITSSIY